MLKVLINNEIAKLILAFFNKKWKMVFNKNEFLYINVNCRKPVKINFFKKSIYINGLKKYLNFFLKLPIDF